MIHLRIPDKARDHKPFLSDLHNLSGVQVILMAITHRHPDRSFLNLRKLVVLIQQQVEERILYHKPIVLRAA